MFGFCTSVTNMSGGEGCREKHSTLRTQYGGEEVSVCPEDLADLCWNNEK